MASPCRAGAGGDPECQGHSFRHGGGCWWMVRHVQGVHFLHGCGAGGGDPGASVASLPPRRAGAGEDPAQRPPSPSATAGVAVC